MTKRLYKVYHLPKYNEDGEDTISNVAGLKKSVTFEVVAGRKRHFYRALDENRTYKVYSHEKDVELSLDDVLLSKWVFDEEKQHILLQEIIRKVIKESNLTSEPLSREKFQEYLDGLERLPEGILKKLENDEYLSKQEVNLVNAAKNGQPFPHGWTLKEIVEGDQMVDMKLGLFDVKQKQIEKRRAHTRRKLLKRVLLVLFLLLFVGGGSLLFVQLQNGRLRTGKVTSSVTPTVNPTEPTAFPLPSGIPTDTSTEEPTKTPLLPSITPTQQPTQTPTEEPTELTLLPSKTPTQQPTQTPTGRPTQSTLLPSKTPTQQPTQTPTGRPTQSTLLPSKTPTKQPTQTPTDQPSTGPSASPSMTPSSTPTISPILPPTKSPSLQEISRLSCEEIRKSEGATEGNLGKNNFEIEIIKGNKYCGDTYGGKDPEKPNRNKWSVRRGRRDCPTFSFEEGFSICDSVGARWCSVEELELLVGKGTGCGGDEQLIYSNSDCEIENGLNGKIKFAPGSQAGKFPSYKCEIDLSSKSLVRCCGDI